MEHALLYERKALQLTTLLREKKFYNECISCDNKNSRKINWMKKGRKSCWLFKFKFRLVRDQRNDDDDVNVKWFMIDIILTHWINHFVMLTRRLMYQLNLLVINLFDSHWQCLSLTCNPNHFQSLMMELDSVFPLSSHLNLLVVGNRVRVGNFHYFSLNTFTKLSSWWQWKLFQEKKKQKNNWNLEMKIIIKLNINDFIK